MHGTSASRRDKSPGSPGSGKHRWHPARSASLDSTRTSRKVEVHKRHAHDKHVHKQKSTPPCSNKPTKSQISTTQIQGGMPMSHSDNLRGNKLSFVIRRCRRSKATSGSPTSSLHHTTPPATDCSATQQVGGSQSTGTGALCDPGRH
jgi:hypothetical protein